MRTFFGLAVLATSQGARISRQRREASGASGPEEHIVLFKDGTTNEDIRDFCGGRCSLMGHPDAGGVAFAQVKQTQDLQAMVAAKEDRVELVEPDSVDYAIPEMEDSEAAEAASWGLERVGVPSRMATGRGQTIYVQDTGVRTTHRQFGGRASGAIDVTGGEVVECADSASCAVDRHGHGTHCAGTAAGATFGVASEATVLAVKTLSDVGSGARSWQIAAIDWVAERGVKPSVISMSLGGSGRDQAYTAAIGAATAAGVTVVVAAGNSRANSCNFSPAFAAEAITVGATDDLNQRATYSNYGSCNDIMAPGSAIVSASATSDTGSRSLSGTSMACPHVSGAAALLLELDQSLKRDQVLARLVESSRKGFVAGLMQNDPDEFLWVGADPAPQPAPTPPPPPAFCDPAWSTGPDADGDCGCNYQLYCYRNGVMGCPVQWSSVPSVRLFHAVTCGGECECKPLSS